MSLYSIFNKVRCFIGNHRWIQNRNLRPIDSFPPSFFRYKRPTRCCERCGAQQSWLPGYGGSEVGCWLNE
jgi:hypothetical protein